MSRGSIGAYADDRGLGFDGCEETAPQCSAPARQSRCLDARSGSRQRGAARLPEGRRLPRSPRRIMRCSTAITPLLGADRCHIDPELGKPQRLAPCADVPRSGVAAETQQSLRSRRPDAPFLRRSIRKPDVFPRQRPVLWYRAEMTFRPLQERFAVAPDHHRFSSCELVCSKLFAPLLKGYGHGHRLPQRFVLAYVNAVFFQVDVHAAHLRQLGQRNP